MECPVCFEDSLQDNHCQLCGVFTSVVSRIDYKGIAEDYEDPHAPEYTDDEL